MIATFKPCNLRGTIKAPTSKSTAHRSLIGAALSGQKCTLTGIDYSEDILASIDCLRELGAKIAIQGDTVVIEPEKFMQVKGPVLECRESGSTLRFFIPLALCLGSPVTLRGSERLFERPLDVYDELCHNKGFHFKKGKNSVTLCGKIENGNYRIQGDISSQFITGMIMALVYLGKDSSIEIVPPFESRSYINLTIRALQSYGAEIAFTDEYRIEIKASKMHAFSGEIEGDYSNAAFLEAFNCIGSEIKIHNLDPDSLQGDRVYDSFFEQVLSGAPTLDISDCPDLGPILFALAALKNGAVFTGTDRLKSKESDRSAAMQEELDKLGGRLIVGKNTVIVPKQQLQYKDKMLDGHNDHRIVMAMSVVLSKTGGAICGAEAIRKSYPRFFEDIKKLGAEVELLGT